MWWYTVIILGLQRQRKRREAFSHLWLQSDSRVKMCYQRPYLEKRNRNLSKELRSLSFKNGFVVCFRTTFSKDIKLFIELMFFRLYFLLVFPMKYYFHAILLKFYYVYLMIWACVYLCTHAYHGILGEARRHHVRISSLLPLCGSLPIEPSFSDLQVSILTHWAISSAPDFLPNVF